MALIPPGEKGKRALDDPVLERVEGDGDDTSPFGDFFRDSFQKIRQTLELLVDFDTKGLKQERMIFLQ